jgi:hemolysin activation/secretion protein
MIRRMGRPGLLGLAARTAVVAGTASATAGAVNRHQQQRAQEQQDAALYQQEQQLQQTQPVAVVQPPPATPQDAGPDVLGQITQLAQLHSAGVLSDAEFAAAKAKVLGT